jgi:hypothetical protein
VRGILGLQREEVAEDWRRLHSEELQNLYASQNVVRVIKWSGWVGHVARMGAIRYTHKILVGKSEGKRPLERHRRRCEDNIRLDFRK